MRPMSAGKKRQWFTFAINTVVALVMGGLTYAGIGGIVVGLLAMGAALGAAISLVYALFDHSPGR